MLDFNDQMKKLKGVKGYLGAAILNKEGETLYLDEEGTNSDIAYSASIFNDAFLEIGESSMDIGFSTANMLEARTVDGHVFLVKSVEGDENTSKLTFFSIFKDDGNVPLAKMVIDRSAVKILAVINDI
ncbi:MAG: Unknown protein [uncultured Sulfurovum sp.]|uniref:Roadblock/LAMTOR2 domain-containing protein n=1 Tax=uncultured Sulfurovum sp. TaxID=269237 RepID=A0A6S6T4Q9_9BACT|nr:MAG: Unknown protein [uncultured Sulfurovum sp.]